MRNAWLVLLALCAVQGLVQGGSLGAVALAICVTAVALTVVVATRRWEPVLLTRRTGAPTPPQRVTQQYLPAVAGRPQPRAPGVWR